MKPFESIDVVPQPSLRNMEVRECFRKDEYEIAMGKTRKDQIITWLPRQEPYILLCGFYSCMLACFCDRSRNKGKIEITTRSLSSPEDHRKIESVCGTSIQVTSGKGEATSIFE